MPNLADKIIELENEVIKIQDESIRQDLQRQIDELKTKYQAEIETLQKEINKSKETEPIYFDRETGVLKDFYEEKTAERINMDTLYGKIRRSFRGREDDVTIFDRKYYGPDAEAVKLGLREIVRKEALAIAKRKACDAVLIKEDQKEDAFCFKLLKMVPTEGGIKVTYRVSADVYFYKKKENAKAD